MAATDAGGAVVRMFGSPVIFVRIEWLILVALTVTLAVGTAIEPMWWTSECQLGLLPTELISDWDDCTTSTYDFYGVGLLFRSRSPWHYARYRYSRHEDSSYGALRPRWLHSSSSLSSSEIDHFRARAFPSRSSGTAYPVSSLRSCSPGSNAGSPKLV
ncbi:hypothetical protein GS438_23265 [Rhodococcus hoagii]|nr:hypothetical protein [Prescottella equi]